MTALSEEEARSGLVALGQQEILATLQRDDRPQLSNLLDGAGSNPRIGRISTTANRVKVGSIAEFGHSPGRKS